MLSGAQRPSPLERKSDKKQGSRKGTCSESLRDWRRELGSVPCCFQVRGHPHFCPTASPLSLLGPRPQVSTDSSPEALWPEVVQKPQQVDSSEDKAHLHSSERGGIGQRGGRQSLRERDEPGRKRLRQRSGGRWAEPRGQEAAMAVPPPSLTIICWQSLQERRSPTFSSVRAASASSTARWPGEERKERGRWRQARRMAVARSRWPGQASTSPVGTRRYL